MLTKGSSLLSQSRVEAHALGSRCSGGISYKGGWFTEVKPSLTSVIHQLPLTCHPSPSLTTFAFRSSEVTRLLLDLDPYGGTDPLGMFPLFLKRTADDMAPRLSVMFRRLVCLGSFPACWRQANVTPIPKGPPSSSVANHRPISITSALSKVFERLVSVGLGRFMERSGVFPTTQFAYRKGLGTCDALLCVPYTAECIGEWADGSDRAD